MSTRRKVSLNGRRNWLPTGKKKLGPNLKGYVIDLRNIGLIAGIELESRPGKPGARAYEAFRKAFDAGVMIRTTGDIIALSPPLIIEKSHIDQIFETIRAILTDLD